MEKVFLDAEIREEFGKSAVKKMRRLGVVPAIVYRHGSKTTALQVMRKQFVKTLHTKAGENVILTLRISKDKDKEKGKTKTTNKTVIIKEMQTDAVKDDVLHIDFNEISLTEKLKIKVPIAHKGDAIGVKKDGGILEQMLWEMEVECLPTQIPEKIEVDVTNLEIGKDIFVKEITVPDGVKILEDQEAIVMSVKAPKAEIPPEEAPPEAEEPEVIREKKPEAEEGEEAPPPQEEPKAKEKKEEKES